MADLASARAATRPLARRAASGHAAVPDRQPIPLGEPRQSEISRNPGVLSGAARGIRTPDPVITNDVLYQLSYCGEPRPDYRERDGLASVPRAQEDFIRPTG